MNDRWNAFVNSNITLHPLQSGILDNLTFSIKDVFAIQNYTNSAGNPDWLRTHQPSNKHAEVIQKLLQNGATMHGTTNTDELMYSLNGENAHYGTPVNPKAKKHIPGGSSSGSAVSVAARLVDFAIGTDTGGSVRIPSSYCGIFGFRPTHDAVSMKGCIPLAKSFDTVGWMANDVNLLKLVGDVLLEDSTVTNDEFRKLYFPIEAWNLVEDSILEAFSPILTVLEEKFNETIHLHISQNGLLEWTDAFRIIQGREIWEQHGDWVKAVKPSFGPGIAERFYMASTIQKNDANRCMEIQIKIRASLSQLLKQDGLLVMPTAHNIAPLLNSPNEKLEENRLKNMQLTCIAGLGGLPQITLPVANINGKPIGLSFIANHRQDKRILEWASSFIKQLEKQNLFL